MTKKLLFLTTVVFALNIFCLQAQTYRTSFDDTTQQADWTSHRKGASDPSYLWKYASGSPHSGAQCLYHEYPVGGSSATDDWFVSPVFDFSSGGKIDSIWRSFSGFGTPQTGDTLAIYVLNGSADPALATSIQALFSYTDSSYSNDNIWKLNTDIIIPALAGQSYIAIRYKTIVNWLDVKFDDIVISRNIGAALTPPSLADAVSLFPNPANDFLTIQSPETLKINYMSVFDLMGRELQRFGGSEKRLDLSSLQAGQYVLRIHTDRGLLAKKWVKY